MKEENEITLNCRIQNSTSRTAKQVALDFDVTLKTVVDKSIQFACANQKFLKELKNDTDKK